LGMKGHSARPKIGWGASKENKKLAIDNRVENIDGLKDFKKGDGIVIGAVGLKKRKEIIAKANEMGLKILNKYKEKKK